MKTILIVAGTKPEIIKTVPVVIEAKKKKIYPTILLVVSSFVTSS